MIYVLSSSLKSFTYTWNRNVLSIKQNSHIIFMVFIFIEVAINYILFPFQTQKENVLETMR